MPDVTAVRRVCHGDIARCLGEPSGRKTPCYIGSWSVLLAIGQCTGHLRAQRMGAALQALGPKDAMAPETGRRSDSRTHLVQALVAMEDFQTIKVRETKQAAEQGDANAQADLGGMYSQGWGVAEDQAQAFHWYRKAAEQGHANAQTCVGQRYRLGLGVAPDDTQAIAWYRKAAEQGEMNAQSHLGWMYENGRGVAQDDAQAIHWYRKAAEQGSTSDQYSIEQINLRGFGGPRNRARRAAEWYRKAAEQGDALAQNVLGAMYEEGKGVAQDHVQAVYWYRLAAEQGYVLAQIHLARMYERGRGVEQDVAQAISWYRKAAERQSEDADRWGPNARKSIERLEEQQLR